MENREKKSNQPVHIINIDVADNHEDATLGAFMILEFAQKVCENNSFKIFETLLKPS